MQPDAKTLFWTLLEGLQGSIGEWLGFCVLIAISIWLMIRIGARFRGNEDPAAVDHLMLRQIRDLHREGDLSDEEYRSIKSRLIERIDDSTRQRANND